MPESQNVIPPSGNPRSGGEGFRFGPVFWVQLGLGLALAGFGVSMLVERGWRSPTGFLILCVGVVFLPFWVARLLGGVAIMALAAWLAIHAGSNFDYLYAALIAFVGFSSAAEGYRGFRKPRAVAPPAP